MTASNTTEHQGFPMDRTGSVLRTMYMVIFIVLCAPSFIAITVQETAGAMNADCNDIREEKTDPVACNAFDRVQFAYDKATSSYGQVAQGRSLTALTIIIFMEATMVLYDAIIGAMKRKQFQEGIEVGEARGEARGRAEGEARGIALMQDWLRRKEEAEAQGRPFDEPMPKPEDQDR